MKIQTGAAFLCLVVSGGHTHLVCVKEYGKYEILGRTRDDAREKPTIKWREQSDLVIRAGLKSTGSQKKESGCHSVPKAHMDSEYDFSFSGLKSSVLNYINGCKMKGESYNPADIAASFQKAVVEVW